MRIFLIFLTSCLLVPASVAQTIFLGALEDVTTNTSPRRHFFGVRVLFQKQGDQGQALPNDCSNESCLKDSPSKYPAEMRWNVGFDGRPLGTVTGRTPKEFLLYAHVGLQDIPNTQRVPTIGKSSMQFGGFAEEALFRPLVANSKPFLQDPDAWKPLHPGKDLVTLVRGSFSRKYPKLCKQTADETDLEPLPYKNQGIQIVKAYVSNKRWRIAQVHLEGAIDCDDTEAGFAMDDPLFVITPDNIVRYLTSEVWLVDAGDWDNDGTSELLFSINRYNRGGYQLFYDHFQKQVSFEFSYH
jgi:hypothetical protein